MPRHLMRDLKRLYQAGGNIMEHLRQLDGGAGNSAEAVLAAYDLQAGSYRAAMADPMHRAMIEDYAAAIAAIIDRLGATSVLEAGVGEATTLAHVVRRMRSPPRTAAGFDISWSRILHGRGYAATEEVGLELVVGDLFAAPIVDQSFDVVFTSHALEPNRGREREAVAELFRLTRGHLVLLEPAWSLGNAETRARIERHQYCTDLAGHAAALGLRVVEHRLFDVQSRADNQTELIVIERDAAERVPAPAQWLGCPTCHAPLTTHHGELFCDDCCLIYPVIRGIACLNPQTAILGSAFTDQGR